MEPADALSGKRDDVVDVPGEPGKNSAATREVRGFSLDETVKLPEPRRYGPAFARPTSR